MQYQPGLHIIAELAVNNTILLSSYQAVQVCIYQSIKSYQLTNLGEVYHNFQPQGFTAVVCLSESHLSLHSWPEYGRLNLDIYLSNYLKDNTNITAAIFNDLVNFFDATIIHQQHIKR